jgi:hypothetical protein
VQGIFGLIIPALVASVAFVVAHVLSQERGRQWMRAAESVGVTNPHLETRLGMPSSLTGSTRGFDITISHYSKGKNQQGTRFKIGGLKHGAYNLAVRAEGLTSMVGKTFGDREIEVGDPVFDKAAFIQGSPELTRALFDKDTRARLRPLLGGRLVLADGTSVSVVRASVSDGELRIDVPSRLLSDSRRRAPEILQALLPIAARLVRPDNLPHRVAANYASDPEPAARLADIDMLATRFASDPATLPTLNAALEDSAPEVQLRAAIALGEKGRETLVALATGDVPDSVAAAAIGAIGPAFPATMAIRRLESAQNAGQTETALACLAAMGRERSPSAAAALSQSVACQTDAIAVAAATALGEMGDAAAEAVLLGALGRDTAVRTAAADALAIVGTTGAVVPLRAASDAHPLDRTFARAAREAIVQIQSRVKGASPGQISLATDQGGQISLVQEATQPNDEADSREADAARGRLSVVQAARAQAAGRG